MTNEQCDYVKGARDMLRESAKQFRIYDDSGHAKLCDMHADQLQQMLIDVHHATVSWYAKA